MAKCAFCEKEIELIVKIGRLDECPHCGKYLHACMQCRLYDRGYHNSCRESQAWLVGDKEAANFCEFFDFGRDVQAEKSNIDEARKKLGGLFRKKG